eukprot:TRINITY_DN73314_c0_g1_i1.p2 TRINITY_DN73314_c0_g1~~TRINITY_DN73314_c0_g1_i1.p2  ORF type:complete len:120 (+),score=12.36 TRINITY_DN73314_c0_g1_i1:26-385(+)
MILLGGILIKNQISLMQKNDSRAQLFVSVGSLAQDNRNQKRPKLMDMDFVMTLKTSVKDQRIYFKNLVVNESQKFLIDGWLKQLLLVRKINQQKYWSYCQKKEKKKKKKKKQKIGRTHV